MHPDADAVRLAARRDRVVEVPCRLRVDREREQIAQVDAPVQARLRRVVRLELLPQPALDQQPLEHRLDVVHAPQHALDPRTAPARAHRDEVAGPRLPHPLPVDQDRRRRLEVRLADHELAALRQLHDVEAVAQRFVRTSSAVCRPSSRGVRGSSAAGTSGRTPTPEMSVPIGVR